MNGSAKGAAVASSGPIGVSPAMWSPDSGPDPLGQAVHPIGTPLSRVDGSLRVTGRARFAAEVHHPHLVFGALVYSTVARGRISSIDTSAAEVSSGVVFVMTHLNAPRMASMPTLAAGAMGAGADGLAVMQDDLVLYNGQPVAVVVAESQEEADHAASLVGVTYQTRPAVTSFADAKSDTRFGGVYFGAPLEHVSGDPEAGLAEAHHRVESTYTTAPHNHNAIEPHAITAHWTGDQLVVHDCTQVVSHLAASFAEIFDIATADVTVHAPYVGGSFGGKTLRPHQVLAVAVARVVDRPVRIALSREGVYRVVGGRAATEQHLALGADGEGRLTTLVHTGVAATARHSLLPEPFIDPSRFMYAAPNRRLEVRVTDLDIVTNTYMRAPGKAMGSFALECAMDELACQIGADPIELRILNEPVRDPSDGRPFSSRHLVEAYRAGAARFGWDRRQVRPRSRRDGEWLWGMGMAAAGYSYYRVPGSQVRISMTHDGYATIETAAQDMGMGTETVQTQVAAARLGLPVDRIRFRYGSSDLPGVVLGAASQQTAAIAAAMVAAHRELVTALLALVDRDSPLYGLSIDEVGTVDGGLCALHDPASRESYTSILRTADFASVTVTGEAPPPEEWLQHWSIHAYGAQFCEVKVSTVTGEVRVMRLTGSYDCGRVLNPKTAASQLRGGAIMALGAVLGEETQFDTRTGRIMNPSLSEYLVPAHADVPEIDVVWTDRPDPHTPLGIRGAVGEIGATGVAAAVANAVFNATGVRVRELPIRIERLLAEL